LPDFDGKYQEVVKNFKGFCFFFFPFFHSSMLPNSTKLFSGWSPLWLHHKILKGNPASPISLWAGSLNSPQEDLKGDRILSPILLFLCSGTFIQVFSFLFCCCLHGSLKKICH
jgi:hypothetical protein